MYMLVLSLLAAHDLTFPLNTKGKDGLCKLAPIIHDQNITLQMAPLLLGSRSVAQEPVGSGGTFAS